MLNFAVCCDVWLGHPVDLFGVGHGTKFFHIRGNAFDAVVNSLVGEHGQNSISAFMLVLASCFVHYVATNPSMDETCHTMGFP